MEDHEREAAIDAELDGLEEDELELSLGLRPAPSRRHLHLNPKNPVAGVEGSGDLSLTVPIWGKGGSGSEQDWDRVGFPESQAKEAQALRRQEARKKRDEKRKSKANAANGSANESLLWFEKQRAVGRERSEREREADFSERRRKGENCNSNGVEGAAAAAMSFLVRPTGGCNSNQLNGLPYLMMPGLVGSDRNGFQPVVSVGGAGSFRPYQVGEKNSGHGGGGGDNMKRSVSSCSRGSSPGVSDYQSTSGQGGSSSDGGSHSSHSHPLDLTITNGPIMQTNNHHSQPSPPQSNGPAITEPSQSLKKVPNLVEMATTSSNTSPYCLERKPEVQTQTSPGKKPSISPTQFPVTNLAKGVDPTKLPKPPAHQGNEALLLSQMPCVSTTGNGPNRKRITGFLYRYTKSEVSIVCVCHGTSFSPAGFVEHAGGVDIENPLRHITVVPFAFS